MSSDQMRVYLRTIVTRLAKMPETYHPVYLSTVVNEVGKKQVQLPTEASEMVLLTRLNDMLPRKLPESTLTRTKELLTASRQRRMKENAKLFLKWAKEQEIRALLQKGRMGQMR